MPNLNTSFNLHIRLTTACNADCTYCSCESDVSAGRIPLNDLKKSLDFALTHFLARSPKKTDCGAEVIGGEVMTLPTNYLRQAVDTIRQIVGDKVKHVDVGCQSNLIGSKTKIKALKEMIDNYSIGTSMDSFTSKRTIKGDADKYRQLATQGAHYLQEISGNTIGTVIVCDSDTINRIVDEYKRAHKDQRRLTIRPIFAGRNDIDYLDPSLLGKHWKALIDIWFIEGDTVIEPLMRMTKSMLGMRVDEVGCPYWRSCSSNSLNIEPNGDLYTCQEMADVGAGKLGNAISGEWHDKMYLLLSKRQTNIDKECQQCQWYRYCQGGCMMESFTETGSFYSRPNNCTAWKLVFKALDDNIKKHGKQTSIDWINKIQEIEYSRIDCSKINHSKIDHSKNKSITVNQSIAVNQSTVIDKPIAVVMQ
jgi:radical SAM protein with 4Fe4S-binding SPASM domain